MQHTKPKHDFEPKIIAFVCTWCTYAGADLAGTSRMQYPANVRVLKFPCTGRIDPVFILKAFQQGADGVAALVGAAVGLAGERIVVAARVVLSDVEYQGGIEILVRSGGKT